MGNAIYKTINIHLDSKEQIFKVINIKKKLREVGFTENVDENINRCRHQRGFITYTITVFQNRTYIFLFSVP
jgi:hypothetical protein